MGATAGSAGARENLLQLCPRCVTSGEKPSLKLMAIQILPILRTLAPLIADAGRIVVGLRTSNSTQKEEDRLLKLEQQTIRAGEILKGVAEQLQALAQELRVQAETTDALKRKVEKLFIFSISALVIGVGSLVVALWR